MNREQARGFEVFVAEHRNVLLRAAALLTGDRHAAEDLYQETLRRLFVSWPRIDNPGGFCRRVMSNLVIDQARARKRRPQEFALITNYDDADPRSGDQAAAAELRPTLLAALDKLTVHQRQVIALRYFEDRSQEEVAEILGISTGAVKSTSSRAVAQLRAQPELTTLYADVLAAA